MMNTAISVGQARELAIAGMGALRRGDLRAARAHFERILAAGMDDASACVALGMACQGLGDVAAAMNAADRALTHEPRNCRALILKGEVLAGLGDMRAASAYFLEAVKVADASGAIAPDLEPLVARARKFCERAVAGVEEAVRERLKAESWSGAASTTRFAESLDLVFGHKRVYFQEPRYYYFPGLPQIQFYDRAAFAWMDRLEAATADIQAELGQVLQDGPSSFRPYLESDPNRPRKDQGGMADNPDWGAWYLWKNGEVVVENAVRCPKTLAAIEDAPIVRIPDRSPSILFSLLRPGARIPPHCGMVNTRLICHLPLVIPGQCEFRVGNEVREWREGKAWAFDDTIEHEAWNRSDSARVILLFEVWRPELRPEEREMVSALFQAIDASAGRPSEWSI